MEQAAPVSGSPKMPQPACGLDLKPGEKHNQE